MLSFGLSHTQIEKFKLKSIQNNFPELSGDSFTNIYHKSEPTILKIRVNLFAVFSLQKLGDSRRVCTENFLERAIVVAGQTFDFQQGQALVIRRVQLQDVMLSDAGIGQSGAKKSPKSFKRNVI